jgi:hypothetical protein
VHAVGTRPKGGSERPHRFRDAELAYSYILSYLLPSQSTTSTALLLLPEDFAIMSKMRAIMKNW